VEPERAVEQAALITAAGHASTTRKAIAAELRRLANDVIITTSYDYNAYSAKERHPGSCGRARPRGSMSIDKTKRPPMWRVVQDGKEPVWEAWPSEPLGWPKLRIEGNSEEDAIRKAHAAMEKIVAPYVAAELRQWADYLVDWGECTPAEQMRDRADELDPPKR